MMGKARHRFWLRQQDIFQLGVLLIIVGWMATYHPNIQHYLINHVVTTFERECCVKMQYDKAVVNLIPGKICFTGVKLYDQKNASSFCQLGSCVFDVSYVESALARKLVFDVAVDGMHLLCSDAAQQDALIRFVTILATSHNELLCLRSVQLKDFTLHHIDVQHITLPGTITLAKRLDDDSKKFEGSFEGIVAAHDTMSVVDGAARFMYDERLSRSKVGAVRADVMLDGKRRSLLCEVFIRPNGIGVYAREGKNTRLVVQATKNLITVKLVAAPQDILAVAKNKLAHAGFWGDSSLALVDGSYDLIDKIGTVHCSSVQGEVCNETSLRYDIAGSFDQATAQINGKIKVGDIVLALSGAGSLLDRTGKCSLKNLTSVQVMNQMLQVMPEQAMVVAMLKNDALHVATDIIAGRDKNTAQKIQGYAKITPEEWTLRGNCLGYLAMMRGTYADGFAITQGDITDARRQPICVCTPDKQQHSVTNIMVNADFLHALIPAALRNYLNGNLGRARVSVDTSQAFEKIGIHIELADAQCGVIGSYNVMEKLCADVMVWPALAAFTASNVRIDFSSGQVVIPQFEYAQQKITSSLEVKDFLINKGKDCYVLLDGQWHLAQPDKQNIDLKGNFVARRSYIRLAIDGDAGVQVRMRDIIEQMIKQSRHDHVVNYALSISTEQPVVVQAGFGKTRINVQGAMAGKISREGHALHEVSGSLRLDGGMCLFAGRNFKVTCGTVDVLSSQPEDPIINFSAQTHVKRYKILVNAHGSLKKPHLTLESYPHLEQEQIISLLLSGFEGNMSINDLPALLLQYSPNLIKAEKYHDQHHGDSLLSLIKPLKYVQVVPYQDTISSQKTVKARVNLDLTPQLRALVYKDILSNDPMELQVEYDLSDECNLKLVRQSSGQMGAEAELRLKF